MNAIDRYVDEVLRHIPRCLPERARIEGDLRSHLADRIGAGESPEEAVARMGGPDEVARSFVAEIEFEPAPLGRRLAAFLIDVALGLATFAPVFLSVWALTGIAEDAGLAFVVSWVFIFVLAGVPILLSIFYFPVTEALWGQTLGKRLLDLCVVKESGERVGWGAAFIRRIPWYVELLWLDVLFAPFTQKRQRAFDLVARTVVVRLGGRAP